MASCNKGSGALEWRLTVSDGSSEELVPEMGCLRRVWVGIVSLILALKLEVWGFAGKIWKMGADDPRRVLHCLKVGISLSLVSLFYYVRPLFEGVGGTAMWAVMTVVVVFEYTVGATLSKGFNRGMATLLAGSLSVGVHSIASLSGDKAQLVIVAISVFIIASAASFLRFIPTIKARFDYGVMIFILTFSLVSVSGYRVDKLLEMAHRRAATIAIGSSMCMFVSMLVCPIWAGEDLHLLITRNMEKLASSLDGCVSQYFSDGDSNSNHEDPCQKSLGYKCVLNTKATEESLANFARWEPAHGQFGFRHPWKLYLKIGTTVRYCACCIEALNASISSEIKAPEFAMKYLSNTCTRLSSHSSDVLKELSKTIKTMRKSSIIDFSVGEMNGAVEDLRNALQSLPNQPVQPPLDSSEEKNLPLSSTMPFMEILPLITTATLLIEIAARIEEVVSAVDELADIANFKAPNDEKPKQNHQINNSDQSDCLGQEDPMKTFQQV